MSDQTALQMAVAATFIRESQIIVAATLTNFAPDVGHLPELVEQAQRNTGKRSKRVLVGAGLRTSRGSRARAVRH